MRFASKDEARIVLRHSTRVIDRYYAKDFARRFGGPKLTQDERKIWLDAFKRKQAAQIYLVNSQNFKVI